MRSDSRFKPRRHDDHDGRTANRTTKDTEGTKGTKSTNDAEEDEGGLVVRSDSTDEGAKGRTTTTGSLSTTAKDTTRSKFGGPGGDEERSSV